MIPIVMIVPRNRYVFNAVMIHRIQLQTIINKSYPIDFSKSNGTREGSFEKRLRMITSFSIFLDSNFKNFNCI